MPLYKMSPESITEDHVLAMIQEAEDRETILWTVGRILREDGSMQHLLALKGDERKPFLRRIGLLLRSLAKRGELKSEDAPGSEVTAHQAVYTYIGSV